MKLDLSEIAGHPGMHATQRVDVPCPADLDVECTEPVTGEVEIQNSGTLLLVTGDLKTRANLECSRCLEDFSLPVEAHVQEQFRIEKVGDAIQVLPMDEDETSPELVTNNMLDVQEMIRQSILLALPLQPLCKPECQGLCPTCGENLNVRKCSCPPAEPESPFKVLAELLEEEDKNDTGE